MPAKAKMRAKGKAHLAFCRQWKARRLELGLSQAAVAKRLDIEQPTYCEIESGRKVPSVETAARVSEALGLRMPTELVPV